MRNFRLAAIALAATAAVPATAMTNYTATLSGLQQSTPNDSGASGKGMATLSDDQNIFTATLSWTGLSAPAAAGHVHCCAPLGQDAPIALDLMPAMTESGSVTKSFNLTALSSYTAEFLKAYGGTAASARSEFLSGLNSNRAYFNIHDTVFPAGEIRGQIGAAGSAGAVPEPASWAMMIAGFAMAGIASRRRRKTVTA